MKRRILQTLTCAAAAAAAWAQAPQQTILQIDIQNQVRYIYDSADLSGYATLPSAPSVTPPTFGTWVTIGDIVAVNGKPVKGTYLTHQIALNLTPTPTAGQAIADTTRSNYVERTLDIYQTDGTPIGSIMLLGFDGGPVPSGSAAVAAGRGSSYAVVGGTGAFLGVRGQLPGGGASTGARLASVKEDPANRRANVGGATSYILQLIPLEQPAITAISHSADFREISAANPASAGETLSLFATGLGPVRGVEPGQPFPASPVAALSSPVEVTVNGKSAQVIGAAGYPGALDGYQVNFQLPPDTPAGTTRIQVSAAWFTSAPVSIPIR